MSGTTTGAPAWRELIAGGYLGRLLLLSLCIWLHAADGTVIATMLPDVVAEIGGSSLIAWTVALYAMGTIVAGASSGILALRYGLRAPLAGGAMLFAAGCLFSALAPSMEVMLLGRLVQGLGGGALIALCFVAVAKLFPPRLMARAMAVISGFWGASAFVGPLVGGIFADLGIWRWGFGFFAAQALVAALLMLATFPAIRPNAPEGGNPAGFPVKRLTLLACGVVAIGSAGNIGGPLAASLVGLAGVAALAGFFLIDARHGSDRLLPRRVFDIRNGVGSASVMIMAFAFATTPYQGFAPVVIEAIHGIPALAIGLLIALVSVSWTVAAIAVSGAPASMMGPYIRIGGCCVAISVPGFALTLSDGSLWWVALWAVVEGTGFGLIWTFMMARSAAAAESDDRERVAAALPTMQRMGYAVGAGFVGIVANSNGFAEAVTVESARAVGFWTFVSVLPIAALGLVAAWRLGGPASDYRSPSDDHP